MRIAFVNEFYPPFAPGGAEWSMRDLVTALSARGHRIVVMTPNYGAAACELADGVQIYRFPFPKKISAERKMPGFLWHANPLYYFYSACQIYRFAKREKIDLIHAQNKYSVIGASLAAAWLQVPVLVTIRDTSHLCRIAVCLHHHSAVPPDCSLGKLLKECSEEYFQNYYDNKSVWRHAKDKVLQIYHWGDVHLRRSFMNRADAVIGVSKGILNVYETSRAFKNGRASRQAIYNFTAPAEPAGKADDEYLREKFNLASKKVVLYVGGFSRGKGSDDFLRSAKRLRSQRADTEFLMIGSGRLAEPDSPVHILSRLSHTETLRFYSLADIVVVPSVCQESLSRVILEALAAGKPVVGTRVGGTPEAVIDGENGFVVERKNPDVLADAIGRILDDDALARRMGERSKALAGTRFSKELIVGQYERLYETCMDERKCRRISR